MAKKKTKPSGNSHKERYGHFSYKKEVIIILPIHCTAEGRNYSALLASFCALFGVGLNHPET